MREQEGTPAAGAASAGRRGGVIRALLGVERRVAEGGGDGAPTQGPLVRLSTAKASEAGGGEERKAVVRVVAADMAPALQRRAFRCARDELAAMPHFPRRLEPKRLALALKKALPSRQLIAPSAFRSMYEPSPFLVAWMNCVLRSPLNHPHTTVGY
ncbi:hypothetical protein PR202_gb09726 [Eleusine coracana subsp. coracana]|uniref:Dynein light chain n=1 Tax=Eleusine coracana subsp. coracana TaxID=191504 RepID=A0AAV5EI44_ELECO|nr:hypothetical protein PR202_gb09726 [Eleusine coracana subsp. coracana]